MADLQFEYVEGQVRPGFPALLADYQRLSVEAAGDPHVLLNVRYGPHERQRYDLFPALGTAEGVLLYFHAGYWQSRDKSQFQFLAPYVQRRGLHVCLVNYPLCPEVSLADLVQAVRPSVTGVRADLQRAGLEDLPLVVTGHSAGAHLAAELSVISAALSHAPQDQVDGVMGISGVYDPEPLVGTTLNHNLQLDFHTAQAANVTSRVAAGAAPGLWVVGGAETPAFIRQNARMDEQWRQAGNASTSVVVPGADHFSILQAVCRWPGKPGSVFENWWAQVVNFHRQRSS